MGVLFSLYCALRRVTARLMWHPVVWLRRHCLDAETRVVGRDYLDQLSSWPGRIILVVGGHYTYWDSRIIGAEIPPTSPLWGASFLTKEQVYRLWFKLGPVPAPLGLILPLLGCIKVRSRDNSASGSFGALRRVRQHFRHEHLIKFAEGGFSPSDGLGPFARSLGFLVAQSNTPTLVVPLALTVDRFDAETHEPLPGAVYRLAIGEPLVGQPELNRTDQRALNAQVERTVHELYQSLKALESADSPGLANQFA